MPRNLSHYQVLCISFLLFRYVMHARYVDFACVVTVHFYTEVSEYLLCEILSILKDLVDMMFWNATNIRNYNSLKKLSEL